MNSAPDSRRAERSLFRSTNLWVLSVLMGAFTVYTSVATIHSAGQHKRAAAIITEGVASDVATLATARLEVIALLAFAPVSMPSPSTPRSDIGALVQAQQAAEKCHCHEALAVKAFYRFDPATHTVAVAAKPDENALTEKQTSEILAELAATDVGKPKGSWARSVHLWTDDRLENNIALNVVQYTDSGRPIAVYGLIADAHATVATLLDGEFGHMIGNDSSRHMTRLDSMSLQVTSSRHKVLYGELDATHQYRSALRPSGPLDDVTIAVALSSDQVAAHTLGTIPAQQLWHIAALLTMTVTVIIVAFNSSRREIVLARARSDFIAGTSHDLRMPLAQILLASETLALKRDRNDNERVSLASSIVRETRRLIALVENVLLYSRAGAVDLAPRLVSVSAEKVFADVAEAVELAAADAGQTIDIHADPQVSVLGDRALLRQALINLVDNSLKYGHPGQHVTLRSEAMPHALVRLIVDDQGPGIPREQRATVFEPYRRLARDQASERTGSGLGLAVVKYIVTACQGTVWVDDAPGGGARVILEFRAPPNTPNT